MRNILIVAAFVAATANIGWADEMLRLKLSMDEFGNCTVSVENTEEPLAKATEFKGDMVKSSRLPKSTIQKDQSGLVRLLHDFAEPDEFDVLFANVLGNSRNVRLDQRFKALTLTSTKGDDAIATYAYRFKPPFTVAYDRYPLADNTVLLSVISLGTPEDALYINLFSLDRSDDSSAKLGAFWIETKPNGQQNRTQLIDPFEFKLDKGVSKTFRLPLPNAKIKTPCFLSFKGRSSQHSVQEISGLLIEGQVTPLFGIGFDERRGVIFTKQIVKGSLAEKVGIQVGDVILSINGENPDDIQHASALLGKTVLGDTATLEIERAGKPSTISIKSE
ncbi:PDZ domain-containing protein [Thalassoglobus neptunius]|uniref:PDZ domain-containing protein n=1 Tax=Thalassoglobus neptunius TaxID=1938619 RepID=UPI0011B6C3C7|nr:PDZ domain-containing protein [Thalassoglobus neptunius]